MESSWNHIKNVFRSSFGYHDECQKYYETVMLDPFLEVTPSIVLSEMVAGFLLHPSGMLGAAVADYSKNVLGKMYFLIHNAQNEQYKMYFYPLS
jgi:hypothetical protein